MRILPEYFGGENCISNEYRPTNLLTCSTDMGLLRHCKISEMPQLGWEHGVQGFLTGFDRILKKEKEERERGEGERERERGREREREREGRDRQTERKGGGENKTKTTKKIKTLICCNLLSKL